MEAQTLKKSEGWLPLAVECLFYLSLLFSFAVLELVGLLLVVVVPHFPLLLLSFFV